MSSTGLSKSAVEFASQQSRPERREVSLEVNSAMVMLVEGGISIDSNERFIGLLSNPTTDLYVGKQGSGSPTHPILYILILSSQVVFTKSVSIHSPPSTKNS